MPDFVILSCPSCGGKLEITQDIERFACMYCGQEHFVRRGGGIISLAPVIQHLKDLRTGVDKTASELAIRRLQNEIAKMKSNLPTDSASSYGRIGRVLIWFAITGCLLSFISADGVIIVLSVGAMAIIYFLGGWLLKMDDEPQKAKLKPYLDTIAEKEKELEYHKKIVKDKIP